MASVVVKANFTLDTQQLLESLAQMDTADLEEFYKRVGHLLESRSGEQPVSPLFPPVDSAEREINLPVVETLIPKSVTLDGDSVRF